MWGFIYVQGYYIKKKNLVQTKGDKNEIIRVKGL